jgi:hypothetical protein
MADAAGYSWAGAASSYFALYDQALGWGRR